MTSSELEEQESFDFIVIGGGSAGCTVASRLASTERYRILLLEAGGHDADPWIHIPVGYGKHFTNPETNWLYESEPGEDWVKRPIAQPRGKVIGGSSSINGLIYIRGQQEDYDHWRQLGNTGWGYDDVLPFFRRSENQESHHDEYHGNDGPLFVSDARDRHPLARAFLSAAAEAGYPSNEDFNGRRQEGFGYYQWTIRSGLRSSAARAYLKPLGKSQNLKIHLYAHVKRINFESRRATSVTYMHGDTQVTATANREIILCGGAFNSPQILQLSGLGPAQRLRDLGLDVLVDHPNVGENLQDHFSGSLIFRVPDAYSRNDLPSNWSKKIIQGLKFLIARRGHLASAVSHVGGFLRTGPDVASPDIQLLLMHFTSDRPGAALHGFPGSSIVTTLLRPESRGTVHIKSADPMASPEIRPNYLSAQKDRDTLLAGLRAARTIAAQPSLEPFLHFEYLPGSDQNSDEELLEFLNEYGRSSYHPVGTCRMGIDDQAVVDPGLRVHGVENLRVIDASVMPALVSGNTNAPTIMIAEKGAEMILRDAL